MENVDVLIIGGGAIGVTSAYYLLQQGKAVTLLEKGEIGSGSSYGNAGLIVPSYSIPLAAPGVLTRGLKWMCNADSPFYVKPRFSPSLFSWLWRFWRRGNISWVRQATPVLFQLGKTSFYLYNRIVSEESLACHYQRNGLLEVYRSHAGFREGRTAAQTLRRYGVVSQLLDSQAVRTKSPFVRSGVAGGVYFPDDAHIDPALFVQQLAEVTARRGADIRTHTEVIGLDTDGKKVTTVHTTRGDFRPQQLVIAGGAWSPGIGRDLKLSLPIQPAKGYSLTVHRPANFPDLPLILEEAKVAVTPMGEQLRFAGTLELAGLDLRINRRRVEAIRRAAETFLQMRISSDDVVEIWRGLRPCTPDGVPMIGASSRWQNVIIAAGHCMLGISLAPVTGRLVAQIAAGKRPSSLSPLLRPDRFRK